MAKNHFPASHRSKKALQRNQTEVESPKKALPREAKKIPPIQKFFISLLVLNQYVILKLKKKKQHKLGAYRYKNLHGCRRTPKQEHQPKLQ